MAKAVASAARSGATQIKSLGLSGLNSLQIHEFLYSVGCGFFCVPFPFPISYEIYDVEQLGKKEDGFLLLLLLSFLTSPKPTVPKLQEGIRRADYLTLAEYHGQRGQGWSARALLSPSPPWSLFIDACEIGNWAHLHRNHHPPSFPPAPFSPRCAVGRRSFSLGFPRIQHIHRHTGTQTRTLNPLATSCLQLPAQSVWMLRGEP